MDKHTITLTPAFRKQIIYTKTITRYPDDGKSHKPRITNKELEEIDKLFDELCRNYDKR